MRPLPIRAARLLPLAALVVLAACQTPPEPSGPPPSTPPPAPPGPQTDRATLRPLAGSGVSGSVSFESVRDEPVTIRYVVDGLTPGPHGFHLHENADCGADATGEPGSAAGGHTNPASSPHGAPGAAATGRHAGDLGTITADAAGHAEGTLADSVVGMDFLGSAVIVHAGADDLTTQPSGNSGARMSCGIVEPRRESGHH